MKTELTVRQIALFFIAFVPITKIFLLPSVLARFARQDLWACLLALFLLEFLTLLALIYTSKKHTNTFYNILKDNFNNSTAKVIYFLYFIYFLLKAYLPISEQKIYVEYTLYETTPTILTFLPFFAVSFYFCLTKLKVIGRIADLFFGISIIGILLLLLLAIPNIDITNLLPILKNPLNDTLKGFYYGTNWFGDAVYFLFFIGYFKKDKKINLKVLLAYLTSVVLVLTFIIFFYCTFSSTSSRQLFALTEIAKYSNVINNIGRFDYFALFLILSSSVFALSLPLFFATLTLKEVFNFKNKLLPAIIVNIILFVALVFFAKSFTFIEDFIQKYFGWFLIIMANVLPALTIFLRRNKNEAL